MQVSPWVVLGLVCLLAGCGGGGGGGGEPPSQSPPPPPPVSDTTPTAFSFSGQTGAARSTAVASNEIVVTDINTSVPVSITGGEYSIDGGAFTSAAGTVANNQTIRVRATSSTDFSATVTVVLTVGGVSASFTITTADPDTTPDAFQFQRAVNTVRGAQAASNSVTIAGIDIPVPVSITNGEYSIDGGDFTSTAGSIRAGQSLVVRARASTTYSRITVARINVGPVAADFEVTSELPNYVPDSVVFDGEDIVYLLNGGNRLVFRWSLSEERYLDSYSVGTTGPAPALMSYSSAHRRLYLGYSSGAIRYVDVAAGTGAEVNFANVAPGLAGMLAVGNYVWAEDSDFYALHYTFDVAGTQTYRDRWGTYETSRTYTWDPVHSRVYLFRDGITPNDLNYEVVDQATGQITSRVESPYHGAYTILGPIRASQSGQYVLLGSGDIYDQSGLTWSGSLGGQVADARWFADGSLATLSTTGNQTTLRHRAGAKLANLEQLTYSGQGLRIVGTDTKMAVLVTANNTVRIHIYTPSNDSDGDGVANTADAFPLDPAASLDTDRDGYPDAWNSGRGPTDSTTGLRLDAYPQDSACYLVAHGNGTSCNYGATIPNYVPDQVVQNGDTVYLLSSANRRVYRWSITSGAYLNPYVVGIDQGFTTVAPTRMAYSSSHQRLYLGYETGAIQYIDVTSGSAEVPFAATAMALHGLAAVGNYVLAQDYSGAWATHYIFDRDGALRDQADWNYYGTDYAWDAVSSRVYFTRDSYNLRYETIDQATGQITSQGEAPYYNSYGVLPPLRVSAGGDRILVGNGDIYNGNGLTRSGSLGAQIVDARWFANGSLVTLTAGTNQTTLQRRAANLSTLEQVTYTGTPLRVVGSDTRMAVLTLESGTVRFHFYSPTDDNDGDGVTNRQDAFPLDPAASVDTDRDGYPDSWNAGRGASDSTTGLSLDAYPQDSACYLSSHGTGATCNYSATVPNYLPDQVAQNGDTVYLLSIANRRVYRWNIATASYMNPYILGSDPYSGATVAPTKMTYSSAHQRLYLAYSNGAIQYIDVSSSSVAEVPFANTARGVNGLVAVGNYVLAQDSGAWQSHSIFDRDGVVTDYGDSNYYSTEYAWDASNSRVYFFRSNSSPGDLHYEVIDQATGQITASGETPYHGDYNIYGPIRVSPGGQYVLLGTGDMYNRTGLTWARSLGTQLTDARWFANDTLAILGSENSQTTLRRLDTNRVTLEQRTFAGTALRIVGSDTRMAVLVNNNGTVQFHLYEPTDDSDDDGVTNTQDAFPLDPAASVDTDRDGYPDSWNAGSGPGDSTTGLSLDAYAQDSACYLASHGDGVNCNYAATIPNYVPEQVLNVGDTVYLLSSANRRVYRWSAATRSYLNPYVVGINHGLNVVAPTKMAYSSAHQRLYLGYSTGAIQYIDVSSGNGVELPLTNIAMSVGGLAAVGNYVLAQDYSGAWATHYIVDSSGVITDQETWNHYSSEYAWDPVSSRVYFFRDSSSPNDLHYEVIDQATGVITAEGESPYHGDYAVQPPLRVSPDGEQILIGSGHFFARADLTRVASLGKAIKDAHWTDRVLVDVDTTDAVEIRDLNTRAVLTSIQYLGQPLRLVFGQTDAFLVHVMNNTTAFVRLPFGDQDGDSLPQWWEQLYDLNDSNAADALGDIDGDGVSNEDEYLHRSNPELVDTDADGLTDHEEIVTHATDPWRVDTDGDGLTDHAEAVTHQSDPRDEDSDDDGYTDFDEVLYDGDPNDETVVPQPLVNYTQSFENNPDLSAWSMPTYSNAAWDLDSTVANTGAASLKSGSVAYSQNSSIRFRGFFSTGELSFYARLDSQYCCNQLQVLVDGVQVRGTYGPSMPWTRYTIPLTLGVHTIEWRFTKESYSGPSTDAAHIDDVVFVRQQ